MLNKVSTKYEAIDGKLFDSYDECEKYNNLPRVWMVHKIMYPLEYISFIDKRQAELEQKRLNDALGNSYHGVYTITVSIVNLQTYETIHEKMTATKTSSNWFRKLQGLK